MSAGGLQVDIGAKPKVVKDLRERVASLDEAKDTEPELGAAPTGDQELERLWGIITALREEDDGTPSLATIMRKIFRSEETHEERSGRQPGSNGLEVSSTKVSITAAGGSCRKVG